MLYKKIKSSLILLTAIFLVQTGWATSPQLSMADLAGIYEVTFQGIPSITYQITVDKSGVITHSQEVISCQEQVENKFCKNEITVVKKKEINDLMTDIISVAMSSQNAKFLDGYYEKKSIEIHKFSLLIEEGYANDEIDKKELQEELNEMYLMVERFLHNLKKAL